MKTLENIFGDLQPGDIVLKQYVDAEGKIEKPQLVIIIGIDMWDMASTVHFVNYKTWYGDLGRHGEPQLESFPEWMSSWRILGHWKTMPKFINLLKAYRRSSESIKV